MLKIASTTFSGSSITWIRSCPRIDHALGDQTLLNQSSSPPQKADDQDHRDLAALPVWIRVSASISSSSVPKPPGITT
jgi:hypothetical protein